MKNNEIDGLIITPDYEDMVITFIELNKTTNNLITHKRKKEKEIKSKLHTLLSNKVLHLSKNENLYNKKRKHINKRPMRKLREESLNDNNIISIFESDLTRSTMMKKDELSESLIIIKVYYFNIFKDIFFNGFEYKGEKYIYFSSSAGQIRTKKAVFIKESIWYQCKDKIMCGLTVEEINKNNGSNVNKYLAYLALSNSATDEWIDFDIDKSIVIDDFETDVFGTYDLIDETDYSITRTTGYVPIPHTDGAGMVLPSLLNRNAMFRAPWIKGLLGVFDFIEFIKVNNYSPIIKDIYGIEHDVIAEDIQVILTKSQFKMNKYYKSWDEYKANYKLYNCSAGLCNIEQDRIKNAKINYQMLQTLTDISDEEINLLVKESSDKITNICTSMESMKTILGITPYNMNMTSFQKAVKIYPNLLTDTYTKDIIRDVKNSLLKKYRSGKLEVNGKFTFILPDLYAACEYWFGKIENPKGLLNDGEVFCSLFSNYKKLDCLRSPHLYKEHAIRNNIACSEYGDRTKTIKKWFITNAVYTSTYDLISKILQFDVDGDSSLVIADPNFIQIAERNMRNVVPLYYNMRIAKPSVLNNDNVYNGLLAAFTGGNIGVYSNDISKIWNSDIFINGTTQEKQEAIDVVKLLCCENNFTIDYAKTLYKPKRPSHINTLVSKFTKSKLPAFFEFAKDKDSSQVEKRNKSFVNSIYSKIPNKNINAKELKLDRVNFSKMMSNTNNRCSKEVADLYDTLNRKYRYMINMKDEYIDNLRYIACSIREQFSKTGYSDETIADMLVHYLYSNNKRYKQLLWFCYGQYIVNNLEMNVKAKKTKIIQCTDCCEWIEIPIESKSERCEICQKEFRKVWDRERKKRNNR